MQLSLAFLIVAVFKRILWNFLAFCFLIYGKEV